MFEEVEYVYEYHEKVFPHLWFVDDVRCHIQIGLSVMTWML